MKNFLRSLSWSTRFVFVIILICLTFFLSQPDVPIYAALAMIYGGYAWVIYWLGRMLGYLFCKFGKVQPSPNQVRTLFIELLGCAIATLMVYADIPVKLRVLASLPCLKERSERMLAGKLPQNSWNQSEEHTDHCGLFRIRGWRIHRTSDGRALIVFFTHGSTLRDAAAIGYVDGGGTDESVWKSHDHTPYYPRHLFGPWWALGIDV